MLVHHSELTQLLAGSCEPLELAQASKSPGTSHAVAVGSPGTWQQTSSIFSWSSLWEQPLQNQLSSWAYPHGDPGCSLALGSWMLLRGKRGWE